MAPQQFPFVRLVKWLAVLSVLAFVAFLFRLVTYVPPGGRIFYSPLTKAELVGTYRFDTASIHGQDVPKGFLALAITLKADGSFVATNVPADCFFSYNPTPPVSEARGTWELKHESTSGEVDYLFLKFTTAPGPGLYSRVVEFLQFTPQINMSYHSGKPDSVIFSLKQQK